MLIETLPVGLRRAPAAARATSLADQVEHALLALDPALVLHAEQAVEQILRNHLRRQRALVAGPAHVAVHVLAVRFLATPICSERKRDFVPIFAASIWSIDGPAAPRPV